MISAWKIYIDFGEGVEGTLQDPKDILYTLESGFDYIVA